MNVGRSQIAVLSACFLGWLASCAVPTTPPVRTAASLENLVESQQARPRSKQDEARKKAETRELTITQTETEPRIAQVKGARFTLSAQDVEVKTILLALGKEIKQNITIEPTISQRATVDLKNVTLVEALDNILHPLHLKYEINKDFINVFGEKMQTRIFKLNYITSRRNGNSSVSASSGTGGGGSGGGGTTTSASGTSASGTSSGGGVSSGQVSSSSIVTSESSDLWMEIRTGLQQIVMGTSTGTSASVQTSVPCGGGGATPTSPQAASSPLSSLSLPSLGDTLSGGAGGAGSSTSSQTSTALQPADRRFVSLNCQAGIIVIRDYPDALLKVAEFLEAVEGSVQRQVFIQAKILEVSLNKSFNLGIDWSKVTPLTIIRNNPVPGSGAPGTGSTASGTTSSVPLLTTPGQVGVFGTILQGSAGLFGLSPSNSNLNIVIDALAQQGNVNVLSSPKIATLNNQRAVIKVGTQDVYFEPQTSSVQGAITTTYLPRTVTIGIVLDVLPQIDANGMVMMSINTSISEKSGTRVSADGLTSVPILDVRESNNVVLSRNGQTIVIGGLMKNKLTKKRDSVPLLGDIPLVGRVFQHDADVDEKTELVIMLTPEIMAGLSLDDQAREAQSSIKQFGYPAR